jgi:hypothetical protein
LLRAIGEGKSIVHFVVLEEVEVTIKRAFPTVVGHDAAQSVFCCSCVNCANGLAKQNIVFLRSCQQFAPTSRRLPPKGMSGARCESNGMVRRYRILANLLVIQPAKRLL